MPQAKSHSSMGKKRLKNTALSAPARGAARRRARLAQARPSRVRERRRTSSGAMA